MAAGYVRQDAVVMREVAGQTLLIPVRGALASQQRIFALNPVARCVWQELAVPRSRTQLLGSVLAAFETDKAEAQRDLDAFLEEILHEGLVRRAEPEA